MICWLKHQFEIKNYCVNFFLNNSFIFSDAYEFLVLVCILGIPANFLFIEKLQLNLRWSTLFKIFKAWTLELIFEDTYLSEQWYPIRDFLIYIQQLYYRSISYVHKSNENIDATSILMWPFFLII